VPEALVRWLGWPVASIAIVVLTIAMIARGIPETQEEKYHRELREAAKMSQEWRQLMRAGQWKKAARLRQWAANHGYGEIKDSHDLFDFRR
jgi:hypothetical protein